MYNKLSENKTCLFLFDKAHRQGTTTATLGRKVLNFPNDSFNANFIVAIHPRNGVEQQYTFDAATHKMLQVNGQPLQGLCTSEMIVLSWYGFDFKDKWAHFVAGKTFDASPKWIFKKDDYTMRTPLPTISATQSANTDIAAITPQSLLNYGNDYNFQMSVDFDFTGASYVNANHSKNPHRSFHRNSGIKIYGLFEVQIYDTNSLLALGNDLQWATHPVDANGNRPSDNQSVMALWKANPFRWQNIRYPNGDGVSVNGVMKTGDTGYEYVAACASGIPYQCGSWRNKTITDLQNVQNVKHIDISLQWKTTNNEIAIITTNGESNDVQYGTGGSFGEKLLNSTDKTIHLQGHWGSGVIFQQIVIQRSEN
jgi:hypothetical protein